MARPTKATKSASEARVRLAGLLDMHFDDEHGRYCHGWDDSKIASECGLSIDVVTSHREALYGPLVAQTKEEKEQLLRDRVEELERLLEEALAKVRLADEQRLTERPFVPPKSSLPKDWCWKIRKGTTEWVALHNSGYILSKDGAMSEIGKPDAEPPGPSDWAGITLDTDDVFRIVRFVNNMQSDRERAVMDYIILESDRDSALSWHEVCEFMRNLGLNGGNGERIAMIQGCVAAQHMATKKVPARREDERGVVR